MSDKRLFEDVQYDFSEAELNVIKTDHTRECQRLAELELRKQTRVSQFTAKIKEGKEREADLRRKLTTGYEIRQVECFVQYDSPRAGVKEIIRLDNRETIREEPMSAEERQGGFGFDTPTKQ